MPHHDADRLLLARAPKGAVPIVPVSRNQLDDWKKGQNAAWRSWVENSGFKAVPGSHCLLPGAEGALAAVLLGSEEEPDLWIYAGLPGKLPQGVYRIDAPLTPHQAGQAALGWLLGSYRYGAKKKAKQKQDTVRFVCPKGADRQTALATAEAIYLVRDLITAPANEMGPKELAAAARALARRHKARFSVIVGEDLLRKNYPMIHAVGRASSRAPRLIDLRWGRKGPKVTLVGKGVVFDAGGLDLKSAAGMKLMKKDMGGAAHVLGLAALTMALKLPVRLRVLVPAVENAVSGNAFRPLDVLPTRKGITVEIGNTDAEGRLILADALTAAAAEKPDLIVDFATLTGAARIALGTDLPALFCNDDGLSAALLAAGTLHDDPVWRMPLHKPYRPQLDSKVADLNNAPAGGYGGAITAALFLEEFIEPAAPWAHFDVMAYNQSTRPGRPEGGEAMGLRAVFAVLEALARSGGKSFAPSV